MWNLNLCKVTVYKFIKTWRNKSKNLPSPLSADSCLEWSFNPVRNGSKGMSAELLLMVISCCMRISCCKISCCRILNRSLSYCNSCNRICCCFAGEDCDKLPLCHGCPVTVVAAGDRCCRCVARKKKLNLTTKLYKLMS